MISRRHFVRGAAGLLTCAVLSASANIVNLTGARLYNYTFSGGGGGGTGPGASWTQVTIPSALQATNLKVYAATDGYLYAGATTGSGIYRALVTDLLADPTDAGNWTDLSSTWPTYSGSLLAVTYITEDPSGTIWAGAGFDTVNTTSPYICVAKWSGSAWSCSNAYGARYATRSIDFDGSGNIWAAAQQNGIFESTDGGATFSVVSADPFVSTGQATGWVYGMKIIDGRIYFGGEGAWTSVNLSFGGATIEVAPTSTHGTNGYMLATDGTQTTTPTEIIATGRMNSTTGYISQRWSGSWADIASTASQYWVSHAVVKGQGAHEYYLSGRRAGGGGGVTNTSNGTTWALFNTGLSSDAVDNADWLTIDPIHNNLFLASKDGSANSTIWMR